MIDVGLVGFGFAGRTFHAPVISAVEGLRLAAIVQRKATKRQQAYPEAAIVRSLDELLAISSIRLVVIATPNPSHFDLAKQCLLAGRDVVDRQALRTTYAEAAEAGRTRETTKAAPLRLSKPALGRRLPNHPTAARGRRSGESSSSSRTSIAFVRI